MSNSFWSTQLALKLTNVTRSSEASVPDTQPRTVFLGIGNEFNGDDAAGVEVVRRLQTLLITNSNILVLDGRSAPENFTGPIRHFMPQLVVLVDCADMGEKPGRVAWLEMDALEGFSASTHTLPPAVLAHFLSQEIDCEVGLIGIQPESFDFGAGLSKPVSEAVEQIVDQIAFIFRSNLDKTVA